jgi:hypothetical protein
MGVENITIDILNGLSPRCTITSFAAIARIHSRPRVEAGLSGREPFDGETSLKYLAVARKLKNLSDSLKSGPIEIPIDWSECEKIRAALADIDNGTLHISFNKEEPIAPPSQQYHVFMSNENFYFVSRRPDYYGRPKISGNFQSTGASQMTRQCADRIVEALAKIGHRAQAVPSRFTGSGIDDFESLWTPDEVKTEQV